MKIHIPAFKAMAKCNEHLNHESFDIEISEEALKEAGYIKEVHGKWQQFDGQRSKCSNCGKTVCTNGKDKTGKALIAKAVYKYCPNCGAKMDGKNNG